MKAKAYAKVNIALDVIGKREDGYHLLRMIMQAIDLYDEILIEKIDKGIRINCNKPYVPTDERNLAYKAAKLFMDKFNIKSGVNITINKNIPVSAGLAGGSTDCAAVLKLMNKMFKTNLSDQELMDLGVKLGADVPYCIIGGTALCEGIGEKITKLKPFKDKILVLVKPPFGVSTKVVYQEFDLSKVVFHPNVEGLIKNIEEDNLKYVASNMKNLLENVTLAKYKEIISIKQSMIECGSIGSMMSGSGPTVFAFFDDMVKAQKCYDIMKKKYKDVCITRTI
ncbi:4-(cytidine 5'-diphospho)-2-C-methyl-D-erythritol kinase [Clostridium sardiniense]|uniref:4-diphosphocytidyl-2-C-methyl-D-erythritol kinase n=1 Tax=Clostridium sardiniense TaxID=29369 RepID=A0ABS7KYP2_CLOSR|nr:4-(cytidine 5'-diphospho)-2-C-methyl-D-erythritol kinase [Clostridium sardiniense]MBY0755718.1 4-(cytidine 5'-diphospho)-2-C-methyl-D-erythritol kinase [Clostridium sardiniense]MDQ0460055.1 4-diphosphocytidyl-2-C-methyl-D-erythritol kinase [Clostridium sardiniense]